MKALSVKQPWASLIAEGHKHIEVRTQRTHYRGPVLICSSLKRDSSRSGQRTEALLVNEHNHLPFELGKALAVVDLIDCREFEVEDQSGAFYPNWSPKSKAWVLSNPRPLKPFPVKGRLGLWNYGSEDDCDTCNGVHYMRVNADEYDYDCIREGSGQPCYWYPTKSLFLSKEQAVEATND